VQRQRESRLTRCLDAATTMRNEMTPDDEQDDEPVENGGFCPKCGGSGRDDYSDGLMDCEHCDGEGYEWWK
jgi:DnaJ-class molecular chaperone